MELQLGARTAPLSSGTARRGVLLVSTRDTGEDPLSLANCESFLDLNSSLTSPGGSLIPGWTRSLPNGVSILKKIMLTQNVDRNAALKMIL